MSQPAVTNHGKLVVNYIAPGAIVGLNFNMAETNWINFHTFYPVDGRLQADFLHILPPPLRLATLTANISLHVLLVPVRPSSASPEHQCLDSACDL